MSIWCGMILKKRGFRRAILDWYHLARRLCSCTFRANWNLKRSRSGDAFTLYFHGDEENWYYHDFKLDGKKGRMNITTSDMTFYEELADLKASKKEETAKDGQSFFFQYMASRRRRDNLVDSYRDFD